MRGSLIVVTGFIASIAQPTSVAAQLPDASALADSIQSEVVAAAVRGDEERLDTARALAERAVLVYPDDALLHHYYGYALYRIAARADHDVVVDPILSTALEVLQRSAEIEPLAETHALIGSVYGLMIGRDPLRGAALGHLAADHRAIAEKLGPDNPRVWLQRGIGELHRPEAYGGGLDRAEESLDRAIELFRSDASEPPRPRWGRADAHVWRGQLSHRRGQADLARDAYTVALDLEPEYAWVSTVLLPALEAGEALEPLE